MSIYIKGMEMPRIGESVTIYPDGRVVRYDTYNGGTIRGEAIPVPPHGRLIDADAELKKLNRICLPDDLSYTIGHDIAKQFLRDATTIIPADPAEEGRR